MGSIPISRSIASRSENGYSQRDTMQAAEN
jgi:hypothetical protein